jgi:hypothetical protein
VNINSTLDLASPQSQFFSAAFVFATAHLFIPLKHDLFLSKPAFHSSGTVTAFYERGVVCGTHRPSLVCVVCVAVACVSLLHVCILFCLVI